MRKVLLLCLLPSLVWSQIRQTALAITQNKSSDSEKTRAIFEWVAKNIAYDVALYSQLRRVSTEEFAEMQKPEKVLRSKKAVCMGYSQLFEALCKAVNIPAETIHGQSKQYDPAKKSFVFPETMHAWNAVKLNNKWQLLDLTWSAGSIDYSSGVFVPGYNETYFSQTPKDFLKSHLPFDPLWQLVASPIKKSEFFKQKESDFAGLVNQPSFRELDETLRLDSVSKKMAAYQRMYQYDPSNETSLQGMGIFYAKMGLNAITEVNKVLATKVNGKVNNKAQATEKLAFKKPLNDEITKAETFLKKANEFFALVPAGAFAYQVCQQNIQNNKQSLAQLSQIRQQTDAFFKKISTLF